MRAGRAASREFPRSYHCTEFAKAIHCTEYPGLYLYTEYIPDYALYWVSHTKYHIEYPRLYILLSISYIYYMYIIYIIKYGSRVLHMICKTLI